MIENVFTFYLYLHIIYIFEDTRSYYHSLYNSLSVSFSHSLSLSYAIIYLFVPLSLSKDSVMFLFDSICMQQAGGVLKICSISMC